METLRTPDDRFPGLADWPYAPHYTEIDDLDGGRLRVHWVDEGGRATRRRVLLLHGEPSWGYLYRHMIPPLVAAGHRVVVPDLVGFGRSDKPTQTSDYTYARHVEWMRQLVVDHLDLRGITFFGQDWGGLVGLRVLTAAPDRYARVVIGNTGLPTGDHSPSKAFLAWRHYSQTVEDFKAGRGHRQRRLPARAHARRDRRLRRALPRRPLQGRRADLPDARAGVARRSRCPRTTAPPGRCSSSSTARSCAPSPTATR